jgi:hypothetical protein
MWWTLAVTRRPSRCGDRGIVDYSTCCSPCSWLSQPRSLCEALHAGMGLIYSGTATRSVGEHGTPRVLADAHGCWGKHVDAREIVYTSVVACCVLHSVHCFKAANAHHSRGDHDNAPAPLCVLPHSTLLPTQSLTMH